MPRRYDILQAPKDMNHADLPTQITISKPFKVNDTFYVCEKSLVKDLKVYSKEKGDAASVCSKNYYVIRKL